MQLCILVPLLALITGFPGSGTCQQLVDFRFTFRSFQTQDCMTDEYFAMYGVTRSENKAPKSIRCAPASVRAGHPDFQADSFELVSPKGRTDPFVKPELIVDESGIGKPQYCNNVTATSMLATGEGVVCGRPLSSTYISGTLLTEDGYYPQTSGKDRFEEWYRDVPGVNKRRGQSLPFLSDTQIIAGKNRTVFSFDSRDPLFSFAYDGSPGFFPFAQATEENGGASYDPFEFQTVWPKWDMLRSKPFSFTSEFHSLFTYRGGETLTFRGDDDVFVYINGYIELEIGGRRDGIARLLQLDKLTYSVLQANKTYTIDLFHAERQGTESNFAITSTLTAPLSIDDVGVTGFDWPSIDGPDFIAIGKEPDSSSKANGSIPLVAISEKSNRNGVRYLFLERKLLLNRGFIIEVGINVSGTSSTGFSILLHNAEIENLPLSGRLERDSEFVGIAQEEGSLGLRVNMCKDRQTDSPGGCTQEVALVANGQATDVLARTPVIGRLADGRVHIYTIRYTLGTEYLEVFIDDSLFLLQSEFQVSEFIGNDATTVGIALFDDSSVPTQSPSFEKTVVSMSSFRVVVGEFRNVQPLSVLDLVILGSVGAITFILILAGLITRRENIWQSLHAAIAFAEDATAVYLLVEKACDVCPGTPATALFLIFCGMELLLQSIPHVTRKRPVLRLICFLALELVQLFLFLNLLDDTLHKDNDYIFITLSVVQSALLTLDFFTTKLFARDNEIEVTQSYPAAQVVAKRLLSDWLNTIIICAFPLITVFVFARNSVFQDKWYQVLVAQNLWYRAIIIDSMVSGLDDIEYNKVGDPCTSIGRAQIRRSWRCWFAKEKVLAISSTLHMLFLHLISATLAVVYLLESPSQAEIIVCTLLLLAFPAALASAYVSVRDGNSYIDIESKPLHVSGRIILKK